MKDKAICTIIAKNYIAAARVLFDSFVEHNPGIDVYVLVMDRIDGYIAPGEDGFKVVTIDDIDNGELRKILFKYDILEASTAVKPFLLDYIFEKYGLAKLIYFDPDILFTDSVSELWELLDHYPILLTPHLLGPPSLDAKHERMELDILRCGVFNLGFLALAKGTEAKSLLDWWQDRLKKYCSKDTMPLFTDQKWINLLPGYFDNMHILRDPGYNVAYWNLSNRKIEANGESLLVNGSPLKFFHFSGLDTANIAGISKYQDRYTLDDLPLLRPLFEKYRKLLDERGMQKSREWPYHFDRFDNGVKIAGIMRSIFLGLDMDGWASRFGDPFHSGPGSYYQWLNEAVENMQDSPAVTRLWYEVYKSRPDLRAAYPAVPGEQQSAFNVWCMTQGAREYGIDDAFLPINAGSSGHPVKRPSGFNGILAKAVWGPFRTAATAAGRTGIKNPRILAGLYYIRKGIDRIFSHD